MCNQGLREHKTTHHPVDRFPVFRVGFLENMALLDIIVGGIFALEWLTAPIHAEHEWRHPSPPRRRRLLQDFPPKFPGGGDKLNRSIDGSTGTGRLGKAIRTVIRVLLLYDHPA